jgi:uncharacterized protein DUF6328
MSRLAPPLSERNETVLERCDRQLAELMQEIRVAQTGVQVLFGFLLTVPFTNRFGSVGADARVLYFATLVTAGAAAMLLIAPGSQHRVLFRCGDKQRVVRMANRYAIAGLACVALAMIGALTLVADLVGGGALAGTIAGVAAVGATWCWYVQPLRRRLALHQRERTARRAVALRPLVTSRYWDTSTATETCSSWSRRPISSADSAEDIFGGTKQG